MSEKKFTPGPWRVVNSDGDVYVRDSGGLIAQGRKPSLYEGQDARFTEELGQYVANASLIASAPDLYAALATLRQQHVNLLRATDRYSADEISEEVAEADAALSKARGEL